MEARASARHVRVPPRKARLVADLVRGKTVEDAVDILKFTPKVAAVYIGKVVVAAMHNLAEELDHPIEPNEIGIKKIFIDEGRTMYRIHPRAQGRAYRIRKRSSHITVVVEDMAKEEKKKK
ncbi:MAG: 50S ribosomal protein L22 [Candidatus Latescibacteria bacterium 4484_7]|nr:MAG: 50S ribosomal protein L22 [Candidatus Latescibacteria bacterium 4484_7]RKZ09139.1 MAG: 50S ribosomal protein L22 [bacterium]